jgi:hypothetical protein
MTRQLVDALTNCRLEAVYCIPAEKSRFKGKEDLLLLFEKVGKCIIQMNQLKQIIDYLLVIHPTSMSIVNSARLVYYQGLFRCGERYYYYPDDMEY